MKMDTRENVELTINPAEPAAALTDEILTSGRAMPVQVANVDVDLHEVIRAVVGRLRRVTRREIGNETELRAVDAMVVGDDSELQDSILSIAINACHTGHGSGTIEMTTENVERSGEYGDPNGPEMNPGQFVQLKIRDDGSGISQENTSEVFNPFFTTKPIGNGTSIGPSFAYSEVQRLGGNVVVESRFGHGSTLTLQIPRCQKKNSQSTVDQNPTPIRTHRNGSEDPISTRSMPDGDGNARNATILLVDDALALRTIAAKLLSHFGYDVISAESGREAVEVYANNQATIDVVVMDLNLPDISGDEALRSIRDINPECRTVISSGFLEPAKRKVVETLGVDAILEKPFSSAQLMSTISSLI